MCIIELYELAKLAFDARLTSLKINKYMQTSNFMEKNTKISKEHTRKKLITFKLLHL